MPHLEFYNTKNAVNESGNPAWSYKDADAIRNVLNYILHPEGVNVLFVSAIGLPLGNVDSMSECFLMTQNIMRQTKGVLIRHEVMAFDNEDSTIYEGSNSDIRQAAYNCAFYYGMQGFQTVYAVWDSDKGHIRNTPEVHFVINAVSVADGHKYRSNNLIRDFQEQYFTQVTDSPQSGNNPVPCIYSYIPDYTGIIYCPYLDDLIP